MSAAKEAAFRKTWRVYQSNIEPKLYNKTKLKQVSAKGQCIGFTRSKMILTIFGKAEIPVGDRKWSEESPKPILSCWKDVRFGTAGQLD